jgi:hypothetical protein
MSDEKDGNDNIENGKTRNKDKICISEDDSSDLDEYEYEINYPERMFADVEQEVNVFEDDYHMNRNKLKYYIYKEIYDYPPLSVIPLELINIVMILVNLLLK